MKRLLTFITLSFCFITSCEEENEMTAKEAVRFSLDLTTSDNGRTHADFPDYISVEMTLGVGAEEIMKTVAFTKTGNNYLSEPVDMPSGMYKLKSLVVDNEDLSGSADLPESFFVSSHESKNISVGKVGFHFRGARPLLIAVHAEGEKTKLTHAKVTVFDHAADRYVYDRSGKIHLVVFKEDPNRWYTLKIEKEGYEVYTLAFTYDELAKKRLAITLQEESAEDAITFQPNATSLEVWIHFTGKGTVTLDWGTGAIETIDFDVDPENISGTGFAVRDQGYAINMPLAKITGDVHLVTGLWFNSGIDALNLEHATAFNNLLITDSSMPILDLHVNNQLSNLEINNSKIDKLLLPAQHHINYLSIEPLTDWNVNVWPSVSELDYIIDNIHTNAVSTNIHEGYISLGGATVSEQSAGKLNELQNAYGWSIDEN